MNHRDLFQAFDCLCKIRPVKVGDEFAVEMTERYTIIRVDRRCWYFRREDGVFDGTSTEVDADGD